MTRLVTFLGPTNYLQLTYARPGGNARATTRFVARAIAELWECNRVTVMATDVAWEANGEALTAAMAERGIAPIRRPIPDGKDEAELREQFRALLDVIREAGDSPLILDITHGFRAQPFFAATVLSLLMASDDLPASTQIVYGAKEATDAQGITPIWDLTPFLLMLELAHGVATLKDTGHGGPLIRALRRESERLSARKRAGERAEFDRSNALVKAVERFCNDLATLRLPSLTIGRTRGKGSAQNLLEKLREYRETCARDHPTLLPLLDDLAEMARPLVTGTLFGEEGRKALEHLARLYFGFSRPLEAAAVAREGYVGLFAESPAATDAGRAGFDEGARAEAERRAGSDPQFRSIADTRNDLLHAAMRKQPVPADAARKNAEAAVAAFAEAAPVPVHAAAPPARVLFVTRHKGAVEWARRQGIEAETVAHLDPEEIRPGDTVIGTLPVHLVAEICQRGARYLHLTLDLPREARGRELSADDLEAFGARLQEFEAWSTSGST